MDEHNSIKFWIGMVMFMKWALIVPVSAGVLGYMFKGSVGGLCSVPAGVLYGAYMKRSMKG